MSELIEQPRSELAQARLEDALDGGAPRQLAKKARAEATWRAYQSDWRQFEGYCRSVELPAAPKTLTAFLARTQAAERKSPSPTKSATLGLILANIFTWLRQLVRRPSFDVTMRGCAARESSMLELPQSLFDIYALALPRGHGFGHRPPVEAWRSEDDLKCGIVTQDTESGDYGVLIMRRRVDHVWTVTEETHALPSRDAARRKVKSAVGSEAPPEPGPLGTAARPALHDLGDRTASDVFRLLSRRTHHPAAWLLNQVYLALPNPDKNWAADCQTANFHTRLWEAQLLASFREQGLLVTQPHRSPDLRIENRRGGEAWVEAVTANPPVPYNHVNAPPSMQPEKRIDLFLGPAAVRFAKTLGNKLQKDYHELSHVAGKPFVIALADFQAPASMVWSREALAGYLYGVHAEIDEVNGERSARLVSASHLRDESKFPAGLFANDQHTELSAVLFSNACSIAKFNRVAVSAGCLTEGLRYVRIGNFFDRTRGALEGIPFSLDITSSEYRSLWPQRYEPWCAELEVFHNPYAQHPLPHALVPEATHWFRKNGEMVCESCYETSILWSTTRIQDASAPVPTIEDIMKLSDPEP